MVFKADTGSRPVPFKTLVMWTPALGRKKRKNGIYCKRKTNKERLYKF